MSTSDGGTAAGPHPGASAWRSLIRQAVDVLWPGLPDGPLWIEAQVRAESGGNPRAVSPAGAQGLLQLMPGTAAEMGVTNPFDPVDNLRGGIGYLRRQFDALRIVPVELDRLYWAFASYSAGRGYIARALALAEMDASLPGCDLWWRYEPSWRYLAHHQATLANGRRADYHQVARYVGRIQANATALGAAVKW